MARLVIFDPARTFDSASLTSSYQDVGAVMGSPVLGFVIYNDSGVSVQLSFDDGVTNGPIIPSKGKFDSSRFNQYLRKEDGQYVLPKGAQIQIKQVTATGTGIIIVNIIRANWV